MYVGVGAWTKALQPYPALSVICGLCFSGSRYRALKPHTVLFVVFDVCLSSGQAEALEPYSALSMVCDDVSHLVRQKRSSLPLPYLWSVMMTLIRRGRSARALLCPIYSL
ncbi:hypothetical protein PoB_000165700 [Plakobranchus ocellatus]|uniref:Uncharacterized protein n=1 Tax=Plakobranchus ocellatus TaxID=259542 RepID=A0AAV3XXF8_9GAST|nr:hypothetical protein PoB_000165700 [Plakobranchus ocellatus]